MKQDMTQDMKQMITTIRQDMKKYCVRKMRALLSLSFLLLMLCLGGIEAWGQTVDYSGTYYIASRGYDGDPENTDNYYLCPTKDWISYKAEDAWEEGDSNPFLTTYKCKSSAYQPGSSNAVWIIEKHPEENYYYIKHKSSGKYMVSNGKINGTSNANRMRVHLETVAQADLDDKALFYINPYSQTLDGAVRSYLVISPKSEAGWNKNQTVDSRKQDLKWYTVNNGNQNYLIGKTKDGGPSGHTETGGIIGLYTEYDSNAQFYFEDVITRPTITFNNTSNQIEITAAQTGTFTIKYTTDGSTPSADNGKTYSAPFDLVEGVTTIKAITVGTDWVSNVTTFTNHKRLIQSQNNAWNTTDFHFYMIPGEEVSGITKVNTTSLFRSSMEWTFQSASLEKGIQYYYIINNATSKNLCYDATNSVYMDEFGSGGDKFKFFMKESSRFPGTFNLIPYGLNILVAKNNGNANADPIFTVGNNTNSNNISENAHWKFIQPTELDTDPPFTVCDVSTHINKFYKIANVGNSGYYIVPPTGNNTNATTSNSEDAAVVKSGTWYFEVAQAATASDWCTYYYIRNAETGKFLSFTKDANDAGACLEMKDAIESGNEERYKFTWARTATENTYYIIPKFVKDASQNQFSTLRRDGGTLKSNLTRGAGTYAWTFLKAPLFCHNPVFEESGENIIMSCNTNAAEIRYTINGQDPKADGVTYLTYPPATPLSASDQHLIKAYAVVSDGTNSAASEDVVILLNKPDITLAAGPYEYKGEAWEPSFTVSIGESGSETIAPTSPATYTTTYTNNVNAGTATVTLTDVEGDLWYIWNGSTTFTIGKKAITITADSDTKGYDGTPLTNDGYTCDPSLATGDSFESVTVTGSQTDVGSSYNVPSAAVIKNGSDENMTANYAITYTNGTLTVTVRSIGDGTLASGFTLVFGEGGTIILKDGEETLTKDTDYSIGSETTSESGKYTQRTVSGTGNYEGYFSIRNANVNFQNDGNGGTEYSATFVAENALGSASNNSDNGHALPEGITAYIITSISGNNANAEALEYIPEGIPVLLLSNAASGGFLVQDASGHTAITQTQKDNNMLEEVTNDPSKRFNFREIYLLYMNEFVHNLEGDLAKGKVYLNPSHSSGGGGGGGNSRLFIRWDTETGIDNSHLSPLTPHPSGSWYTLDGRRLNRKPTQKGLYLCNGQKTVVN